MTITYVLASGETRVVTPKSGVSVMRAALADSVPGIIGECGGQAMCATCHVYVRPEYLDGLPERSDDEEEMLDCTAAPRDAERSRLGCQLTAGQDFTDLVVDVPATQV